jgi:hypothetical protein
MSNEEATQTPIKAKPARSDVREVKGTPPRVDPTGDMDVTQAPHLDQISNYDPEYTYLTLKKSDLRKYLRADRIGAEAIGFKARPAWELVTTDHAERPGRAFADQGAPIDSSVGLGELALIRMKKTDWEASYGWLARHRSNAKAKRLFGKTVTVGGGVRLTTETRAGDDMPEFIGRSG